jgi:hypothetical protein
MDILKNEKLTLGHSVEVPCREYGFDKTSLLKCATVSIKQL